MIQRRRPARIERSAPALVRRAKERLRPAHLAFIRTLPCVACGKPAPSECAHVRMGTGGGMGYKPADRYCLPLCGPMGCHARQHQIGETAFWAELGVDAVDITVRLWAVTGDADQGLRTVERAWQAIALHRAGP